MSTINKLSTTTANEYSPVLKTGHGIPIAIGTNKKQNYI